MSPGIVFHTLAFLGYALLAAVLWRFLPVGQPGAERPRTPAAARAGLAATLVLHGIGLYQSMLGDTALYLGWALALSAAVWLGLIIFWIESLLIGIDGLLLLLLPLAALSALLAALFPGGQAVAHADNPWLQAHLLIALAAYSLITVAALQAMLMAALDRHLHHPLEPAEDQASRGGLSARVLYAMPPLLVQERLLFRLVWIGFVALTLAVGSGSVISLMFTGHVLPFDHKTIFTLLSWLTFGLLLIGRQVRGWRGRIALRWTLTGFAFLLLAYTGSRFVLEVVLHRG